MQFEYSCHGDNNTMHKQHRDSGDSKWYFRMLGRYKNSFCVQIQGLATFSRETGKHFLSHKDDTCFDSAITIQDRGYDLFFDFCDYKLVETSVNGCKRVIAGAEFSSGVKRTQLLANEVLITLSE